MIDINDTYGLIKAAEQIKPAASYLLDTFFPKVEVFNQTSLMVEYRKRGRERLAPYVVEGAQGINVSRAGSIINTYTPPMVAPRRVMTQADIMKRGFGEMPLYTSVTPEERAARMQADDLYDLRTMIANRKNEMAASILTSGKVEIEGFADDGVLKKIDTITYDWDGEFPITDGWDVSTTSIFDCLQSMSEKIQEDVGIVPSLLIVGKNIPNYLRKNKELKEWLMIPNRQNAAIASFEPRYVTPQVQYVGTITALGLEVVCYNETYTNDAGDLTPYLGADEIIMGVPGRGTVMHGAVTLINDAETGFGTYAAEVVPSYLARKGTNQMTLTLWSRFILVPAWTGDWVHAKVKL